MKYAINLYLSAFVNIQKAKVKQKKIERLWHFHVFSCASSYAPKEFDKVRLKKNEKYITFFWLKTKIQKFYFAVYYAPQNQMIIGLSFDDRSLAHRTTPGD